MRLSQLQNPVLAKTASRPHRQLGPRIKASYVRGISSLLVLHPNFHSHDTQQWQCSNNHDNQHFVSIYFKNCVICFFFTVCKTDIVISYQLLSPRRSGLTFWRLIVVFSSQFSVRPNAGSISSYRSCACANVYHILLEQAWKFTQKKQKYAEFIYYLRTVDISYVIILKGKRMNILRSTEIGWRIVL